MTTRLKNLKDRLSKKKLNNLEQDDKLNPKYLPEAVPYAPERQRTFFGWIDKEGEVFAKRLEDGETQENLLKGREVYRKTSFTIPENENHSDEKVIEDLKSQLYRSWMTRPLEKS